MRGRSKAAIILSMGLGLALSVPNGAAAAPCAALPDRGALQVRMLQTELMVAALSCNQRDNYNAFVKRFQPELVSQGQRLQRFFKREYGAGATRSLNSFITRIANEASRRSMAQGGGYCQTAAALYQDAKATVPGGLGGFAQRQVFAGLHGFSPCSSDAIASRPTEQSETTSE